MALFHIYTVRHYYINTKNLEQKNTLTQHTDVSLKLIRLKYIMTEKKNETNTNVHVSSLMFIILYSFIHFNLLYING